ncbi:hypothetical protein CKM354_000666500 [Cercospora kikuchii]|uniref:Uncharacterized protein n=1 Tax=Cercospora kikuchii TaxID=84275 RepID=A0A9P3CHR0_9PEZI|nr:uncharacterized protein CKM354_000666500 [Cercospora kikuchii]GIZ43437.1 hypothetical protein CKM354_000666500 [Cercospora kikuchii]
MARTMTDSPADDWRNAQKLIKNLFIQEKYRQCIQLCREILKANANDDEHTHPLQDAFINFYLGLCFNEVARMMHHNSIAKLPAFDDAERHYLEALTALPTAKDARALCVRHVREPLEDPFVVRQVENTRPFSPPLPDSGFFDRPCSRASSLMLSSPDQRVADTQHTSLASSRDSPVFSACDMEDLESHHSFADLMTPNRLRRDYPDSEHATPVHKFLLREGSVTAPATSSPAHPPGLQITSEQTLANTPPYHQKTTPTGGLMRPVRMGSLPKPYQDSFSAVRPSPSPRPKLSRLSIDVQNSTRVVSAPQLNYFSSSYEDPDHASPVSPVSPNSTLSFGSSVSPISPISPIATDGLDRDSDTTTTSAITPSTPKKPEYTRYSVPHTATAVAVSMAPATFEPTFQPKECLDVAMLNRITDHLAAMRTQLETHMKGVQRAQEQIHRAQALQRLETPSRSDRDGNSASNRVSTPSNGPSRQKSLRKSRSFWSFAPEDQKARKKKEHIEAGRARRWKRERFDPSRYQTLCEQALAEL